MKWLYLRGNTSDARETDLSPYHGWETRFAWSPIITDHPTDDGFVVMVWLEFVERRLQLQHPEGCPVAGRDGIAYAPTEWVYRTIKD